MIFDADTYLAYGKRLALKLNCVLVLPDFRNAPEAKTPKGMKDVYNAFMHVYDNHLEYGIDKNRISMTGASGGSFLALGASIMMI